MQSVHSSHGRGAADGRFSRPASLFSPVPPRRLPPQNADGSYGQVPYASYFPEEVAAIVEELDDWITGEPVFCFERVYGSCQPQRAGASNASAARQSRHLAGARLTRQSPPSFAVLTAVWWRGYYCTC